MSILRVRLNRHVWMFSNLCWVKVHPHTLIGLSLITCELNKHLPIITLHFIRLALRFIGFFNSHTFSSLACVSFFLPSKYSQTHTCQYIICVPKLTIAGANSLKTFTHGPAAPQAVCIMDELALAPFNEFYCSSIITISLWLVVKRRLTL